MLSQIVTLMELRKKSCQWWTGVLLAILIICYLRYYWQISSKLLVTLPTCSDLLGGAGIAITENPILSLASLSALSPPISPHPSCSPPTLPPIPSCAGQPGLTGERLAHERKVVLMMMFGFEVDTLEISLRSQLDWVDTVFLVEATSTTKGVGRDDGHEIADYYNCIVDRWPSLSCGRD